MKPNPLKQAAKARGEAYFFTGTPCIRGHIANRKTRNGACSECERQRTISTGYFKLYYAKNSEEAKRVRRDNYRENRGSYIARARRRQGVLEKQTPRWAELAAINLFYKNCPAGYHVDHEIPLQGKLVSGLHVLPNLRYLLASENKTKYNKFDPNTWVEPCHF